MRLNKIKYLIAFTIIIFIIKGCGIFETREPEDPNLTRSTFIPPTNPDAVVTNLTYSVIERNSNNYHRCIDPQNYLFFPDSKSQLKYGQIFLAWNYNSEKMYMDNILSSMKQNSSSNLFLSNKIMRLITTDSAVFSADYIVVFQHEKPNIPKSSNGNVRLTITSDELNNFYINRWEDFRENDTDFTWSELKANFSN